MRCHWSWFFKYWCLLIDKCCILGLQQILTFFKYYIRIRIKNADSDPEEGHCLRILSGSESETQLTAPVPITSTMQSYWGTVFADWPPLLVKEQTTGSLSSWEEHLSIQLVRLISPNSKNRFPTQRNANYPAREYSVQGQSRPRMGRPRE